MDRTQRLLDLARRRGDVAVVRILEGRIQGRKLIALPKPT